MELGSVLAEYSRDLRPNGGTLLGVISPLLGELDPLRVGLGGLGSGLGLGLGLGLSHSTLA